MAGLSRAIGNQHWNTDVYRQQRLAFAQENVNRDWSKVLFSDEKVYRYDLGPTRRSAVFWGWMSVAGPVEMCYIGRRLNHVTYTEVLQEVFIPSMDIVYPGRDMLFMQDNHPVHNSKFTREWFNNHPEIQVLKNWPCNSPDLNPMDNLWREVTRGWENINPINVEAFIVENWEEMRGNNQYFSNLYASMPNRIRSVINNNGGPIAF